MRRETGELIRRISAPAATLTPVEWCERYVVLPAREYPTSDPGQFSYARVPFWIEPANLVAVHKPLEIIIWKCSQSNCTESVLQNSLRWASVNDPAPHLWVSSQSLFLEEFWKSRISPGLTKCGAMLSEALAGWSDVGTKLVAPNGEKLTGTWSTSGAGLKGESYKIVFADEVSTYPNFTMEKLRSRVTAYPDNSKIYAISALDKKRVGSTKDDPLWIEWDDTDKREWMFDDPAAPGEKFQFSMGWRADKGESTSGVKWDRSARREDGSWDYNRVEETAHFVTPGGAVITEADRIAMINTGEWIPTAEGRPGAYGYRVPCFLLRQKSFGKIASSFLRAKKAGKEQLRTFIMEQLAEPWFESRITIGDTIIDARRAEYQQGERMSASRTFQPFYVGASSAVLVSGDVQKDSLYFLAREWVETKSGNCDSGLIDWQEIVEWSLFEDLTQKYDAACSLIDTRYKWRRSEVLEYALKFPNIIPCQGNDSRMKNLFRVTSLNPYEGRAGNSRGISVNGLTFDSWSITFHLFQLMQQRGNYPEWRIPKNITREYIKQVTAEEMVEGKPVERHPGAANHLLDCEKLQVLGALCLQLLSPFSANFTLPEDMEVRNPLQLRMEFEAPEE